MIETQLIEKYVRADEMPAGKYWIGDPCYFVPDEDWHEVLDETGYFGLYETPEDKRKGRYADRSVQFGMFPLENGQIIAASTTAHGDGEYTGSDGFAYGVDAGMIGAVPYEYGKEGAEKYKQDVGTVVEFKRPFTIEYDNGTITIGNSDTEIVIETDASPEPCEQCGEIYCTGADGGSYCEYEDDEYDGQPDEAQEWYDFDPDC